MKGKLRFTLYNELKEIYMLDPVSITLFSVKKKYVSTIFFFQNSLKLGLL